MVLHWSKSKRERPGLAVILRDLVSLQGVSMKNAVGYDEILKIQVCDLGPMHLSP